MNTNHGQQNIPSGWSFHSLRDRLTLVVDNRGKTPPIQASGIPMAEVNAIGEKNINYSAISKFVSEETYKTWFRKHLEKNDILFSTVGRTASCSLYTANTETVIAQNLVGLRFRKDNPEFMFYLLSQEKNNWKFKNIEMSAAQPSIKVSQMLDLEFLVPPLPEQKRIVAVLETWDQLIEKLTRKIEIKKAIKRGLMQELLTGEVRLTGFMSNWSIHNLGELGKIVSGGTPETSDSSYWGNDHIWITPTEITKLKSRYIFTSDKKISSLGLKNSSAALVPPQSLILCSRATIAECAINTVEVTTNQGFKNFIPKKIDISFLYYWVKLNKKAFYKISAGSTFLEFGKGDMEKLKISIPELKEQKAISEILIKADDEIDRLKSKLSIIKDQKRYLLNNLITGTIRTPESLPIPN